MHSCGIGVEVSVSGYHKLTVNLPAGRACGGLLLAALRSSERTAKFIQNEAVAGVTPTNASSTSISLGNDYVLRLLAFVRGDACPIDLPDVK